MQAYQNIRLLRLAAEYLVHLSWNMLAGFPGEDPSDYDAQARLVPSLYHLTPPSFVGRVRLDRFSPLFERSASLGVTSVRPAPAYECVYPFEQRDLADLAYYFEFDYRDGRRPLQYLAPIQSAVNIWKQEHATSFVLYLDNQEELHFVIRRSGGYAFDLNLKGWERAAYYSSENGATAAVIYAAVLAAGYEIDRSAVNGLLNRLVELGIVISIDNRFLGIAVGVNYWVEVLSDSLTAGRQVPSDIATVIKQLFDVIPDVLAHHLSMQVSKAL